jgi:hypothetical protein
MRLILKIWLVFFATAIFTPAALAASFTALLDRDTITVGEQAALSLTFEGGQSKNVPTPSVPGLQIIQTGTAQNMSFINGAMSSTVTVNFSVTAQRAGEFTIPALTADVNGEQLVSAPLKLTVNRPEAPSANAINAGDQIAFLKFSLPQTNLFVGQTVVAQLQICLRDDVQNLAGFQFTAQNADGFTVGKMTRTEQQRIQVGNRIYNVVPLNFPLTVVKNGNLKLGPFTADAVVVVAANQQGGDPFQRFFNQGEQKQISLTTDTLPVAALPLPTQGQPPGFNGAVGNFTMNSSVGPRSVAVGDPVTVRVQISGHGALDSVKLPDQSALNGFKIFPPTVKTELSGQLGLDGTKTFEEIVTPQNSDVREWPPFSFSFFNPDDGHYHTLTQAAVPLTIQAVSATPLPAMAKTAVPENQTPPDILPIKQNLGTLAQIPVGQNSVEPLIARPGFLALQSLPVLAFLAALIWRKRADNLANNPRLRRKLAVAQLVNIGLNDLKKFAAENNPDEFFALLFRLLQEQLGERLDCPATAITENVVEENPLLRNATNSTRDGLRELFQLCNQARYAPVRGTSELNLVTQKFEKTVGELQEVKA